MTIEKCSACGKRHLGLPTEEVKVPHRIQRETYYVIAICPNTKSIIYPEREKSSKVV